MAPIAAECTELTWTYQSPTTRGLPDTTWLAIVYSPFFLFSVFSSWQAWLHTGKGFLPMVLLTVVFAGLIVALIRIPQTYRRKFYVSASGYQAESVLGSIGVEDRLWNDIHSIDLLHCVSSHHYQKRHLVSPGADCPAEYTNIVIDFISGGTQSFSLDGFSPAHRQSFLEHIREYVPPQKLSLELVKYYQRFCAELQTSSTFTSIWTADLERRHATTHFVSLSPGTVLQNGEYTILQEIGAGGLSAVYLIADKEGTRKVLKESVLPLDMRLQARDKAREMFSREARLLSGIAHQQIVKVYDNFVVHERDYLVLEYIAGPSLRQSIEALGPADEERSRRWAEQIANILSYLHSLDPPILHKDLTPDNLVLKNDDSLVLIDFGAANHYVGSATGTLVGKQSYIAPEQFRGKPCPASDIYSLGCTLYFVLTGRDPVALSTSHILGENTDGTSLRTVSPQMDRVVSGCTGLELATRYCTAEEVLAAMHSSNIDGTPEQHKTDGYNL